MYDRAKHTRLQSPLSFPVTRDVLWDHSPAGDRLRLSLTDGRCIRVRLAEQTLLLAADRVIDVPRQCCLRGSVGTRADGQEIVFDLGQLDVSDGQHQLDGVAALLTDTNVPLTIFKRASRLAEHELQMHMETSFMLLRCRAASHKPIDLAGFLPLRAYASFGPSSAGALDVEVTFDLAAHGSAFTVTPIAPVPVADTALSMNLIRDQDRLTETPRTGFLTMDQTRKLVFMLESDPKAFTMPLVGVWVKGVDVITHPYVWAACTRYLSDAAIGDRACGTPSTGRQAFLIAFVSATAGGRPRFFDCCCAEEQSGGCTAGSASTEVPPLYRLLTSTLEHGKVKGASAGPTRAALCFDLCPVSGGPRSAPFAAAAARSSSDPATAGYDLSRLPSWPAETSGRTVVARAGAPLRLPPEEDAVPRASPSPHAAKGTAAVTPSVPDVSLILDAEEQPWAAADRASGTTAQPPVAAADPLPGLAVGHGRRSSTAAASKKVIFALPAPATRSTWALRDSLGCFGGADSGGQPETSAVGKLAEAAAAAPRTLRDDRRRQQQQQPSQHREPSSGHGLAAAAVPSSPLPTAATSTLPASRVDAPGTATHPAVPCTGSAAASNAAAARASALSPPPDLYELLRRQDEQLRSLQEQIGRLLQSQPSRPALSPGGGRRTDRGDSSSCSGGGSDRPAAAAARAPADAPRQRGIPLSPVAWAAQPAAPGQAASAAAEAACERHAESAGGRSDRHRHDERCCDGQEPCMRGGSCPEGGAQVAEPHRSVAVSTGISLCSGGVPMPAPDKRSASAQGATRQCQLTPQATAAAGVDGCSAAAADGSMLSSDYSDDDDDDLGTLHAMSTLQEPPASFASSALVIDMPSYASTMSKSRLTDGGAGDSSYSSVASGDEPMPNAQQQQWQQQQQASDRQPLAAATGAHYYSNLIRNVRDLLAKHEATKAHQRPPEQAIFAVEGGAGEEPVGCTGGHGAPAAAAAGVRQPLLSRPDMQANTDVTADPDAKAGAAAAVAAARSLQPPLGLLSALLPRAEHASALLSVAGDDLCLSSDRSMEVNALAMKYLGDRQLTHLARLAGAAAAVTSAAAAQGQLPSVRSAPVRSGVSPLLLHAVLPRTYKGDLSLLDTSSTSPSNWLSFASTKYLRRHGLLEPEARDGGTAAAAAGGYLAPVNEWAAGWQQAACDSRAPAATAANDNKENLAVTEYGGGAAAAASRPQSGQMGGSKLPDKSRGDVVCAAGLVPHAPLPPLGTAAAQSQDVQVLAGLTKAQQRRPHARPLAAIDTNCPAPEAADIRRAALYEPAKILDMEKLRELPKLL